MTDLNAGKKWMRIPDGTKVRLAEGGQEGVIDGLTEFIVGAAKNPDGRTQYRINTGDSARLLVAEAELLVLTDTDGVVLMLKQNIDYRRIVTGWLRDELSADRFVRGA